MWSYWQQYCFWRFSPGARSRGHPAWSRAGYSDLGVNRKRLESLRSHFQELQDETGSPS
ncbi:DUF1499 domain-containing protein, partial [Thiolapillus sp.]